MKLMVFDVTEVDGQSMEEMPLISRKQVLPTLIVPTDDVIVVPYTEDGLALFEEAKARRRQGLVGEGIVGKHKQGAYVQGKRGWLKVKTWQLGTFYVCGYTKGTGWRKITFGALMLMNDDGVYVGQVGTGMDTSDLKALMAMFKPAPCPFHSVPEPATWVKPFPVRIQYLEYTNNGILRFPSLKRIL